MALARRYKLFLWVGLTTFILDQATKIWARTLPVNEQGFGETQNLIDCCFAWRLSFNTGSAFGLFGSVGGARVFLTLVGIVACIAIVWMLKQARDDQKRYTWALGLVAGGAIGNVLDRLIYGKVTDFVVLKWQDTEWPTFNVADIALVVGVGLLFLDIGKDPNEAPEPEPDS